MSSPIPPLTSLEKLAKRLVFEAKKNGILHKTTAGTVRKDMETQLELEPGALDAPEYKKPLAQVIREAATAAEEEDKAPSDMDGQEKAEEKERVTTPKIKRMSKSKVKSKEVKKQEETPQKEERDEKEGEEEEEDGPKKKKNKKGKEQGKEKEKGKTMPKKRKGSPEDGDLSPSSAKKKKKSNGKESKDAAPSSGSGSSSGTKTVEKEKVKAKDASKGKKGKDKVKSEYKSSEFVPPTSDVEGDEEAMQVDTPKVPVKDEEQASSDEEKKASTSESPSSKRKHSTASEEKPPKSKPDSKTVKAVKFEGKSEIRPTVEEDSDTGLSDLIDEPPKKKGKSKATTKAPSKKREKAPKKEISKDEETIKRLKSFVTACGVRKVWSHLFEGIENQPSKQIKMLRQILEDLGMGSRPSMEKARAIRARRELEDELAEVQAFEKSLLARGPGTKDKETEQSDKESEDEEEEEEEDVRPAKKKGNARQSIMAFLADQSDSE
ncbi:hypothetical protein K435DRAFT_963051 [Dendrothele bispora CBS 962.96]|uniref:Uncharacterized protein n=1 Tax=Dendrothele bispora (strain CBS 962.96) TaxID=1314807 RepID=A0A4S8MIW9_DENBC|nr:hypothetical protein K435DRAFT_963051 [Dendrothele bispora CBS 962.96]